ncbi:B-cell receptor CD22-like [Salarias fasciatus]|uniref:B-cell receptor CD22-like n=1 Tax=Salarias fasciatus TaxID=181472 RepID=UPI0011767F36|nr:B-cell receptor CD22-like [Salarias fasciatus]
MTLTAADQLENTHLVPVNMFLLLTVFFLPAVLVHCAGDKAGLFITAPRSLEAVNGSCLIIPCSFTPASRKERQFDNRRQIVAVWIKDDWLFQGHPERIVFNSSDAVNYRYISIIGDLRERDCTTKFNIVKLEKTTKFFFRIENESFKATAALNPVEIKLKGSPPRPRLEVSADLKDLKEKESVTVTCSSLTPCSHSPPQLTWSLQQDAHSQTEENTDGTFSTQIQKTLTLSDTHDGFSLSCSAVYPVAGGEPVKTPETELTLRVSYSPKDTTVSISPSGSWVTLTCSSRAKPAVSSFTWFKNSDHGPIKVSEGDFYTFNVANITDPASFYCVAENSLGNQTSLWIHVNKADTTVSISPSGSWVTLTCSSRAKPAVSSFSWFKNSDHGPIKVSEGDFYTFNVANITDPASFYCVDENALDELRIELVLKTLMILQVVSLYCTIIIFECWFKWRHCRKQVKDSPEADYVNTVNESPA